MLIWISLAMKPNLKNFHTYVIAVNKEGRSSNDVCTSVITRVSSINGTGRVWLRESVSTSCCFHLLWSLSPLLRLKIPKWEGRYNYEINTNQQQNVSWSVPFWWKAWNEYGKSLFHRLMMQQQEWGVSGKRNKVHWACLLKRFLRTVHGSSKSE